MALQQALKEPRGRSSIPRGLQIHINHVTILICGPPEVMLLAIDSDKGHVNAEGIAVSSILAFHAAAIDSAKLDAPQSTRFTTDSGAAFGK